MSSSKNKFNNSKKNRNKKAVSMEKSLSKNILWAISALVILIRILTTLLPSHKIDISVLKWEIGYLADNPLNVFDIYVHFVYGPVYAYFLWISGEITRAFSLSVPAQEFLIKIWAVIFDIIGAVFVYLIGKKYNKEKLGLGLAVFYALNPAIIFNSSVWGQFDGITATLFISVIYFFNIKKSNTALFLYAVAALTKPQSIAIFPIVVILYFMDYPWSKFSEYFKTKDINLLKSALSSTFSKLGTGVLGCMLIYAVLIYPFYSETPFYTVRDVRIFDQNMNNLSPVQINASASIHEDFAAVYAADSGDGKDGTFWSSGHTTSQWLAFDLGVITNIREITINWGYEHAKKYSIQVSGDSNNWTTVHTQNNGKGKLENIQINATQARFIKINCEQRPFPYGLFQIDSNTGFIEKAAFKTVDYYYWLMHHYSKYVDDYPYATANAFNLWTILGKQTVHDSEPYLFNISLGTWGYIFLFGIAWLLGSILILVKKRSVLALYYSAFFIAAGMFVFTSRIHERYLVPALIFATVCILWDKLMWIPTIVFSSVCLANQWYVYDLQNRTPEAPWISPSNPFSHFIAWITFLMMLVCIGYLFRLLFRKGKQIQHSGGSGKKPAGVKS